MVGHDVLARGVDLSGTRYTRPVIVQMHDDDFPARFLTDLAAPEQPAISHAKVVNLGAQPLYQPVQRMVNLAMVDLRCDTLATPRLDPTKIVSSGVVVRRVYLRPGVNGGAAWNDPDTVSAWMRSPSGKFGWVKLNSEQEDLDPDPANHPQLKSGDAQVDRQLAAMYLATAGTESTTPAFAAPPETNTALGRTVVYALIPTASSEVSDTAPKQPQMDSGTLLKTLPPLLRSSQYTSAPAVPAPDASVDYRWMSDDYLNAQFGLGSGTAASFAGFSLALRMLHSVFNAFDGSAQGAAILNALNAHNVTFSDNSTQPMGDFYQSAKSTLLDYNGYGNSTATAPTIQMPTAWDALNDADQSTLLGAMTAALGPRSQPILTPQGRFQDSTRYYKLRMFFRIKGDTPQCPPKLVWSDYSDTFRIAAWHETGERMHPPVPLPDPTAAFLKNAKPNCSFQVPASLMSAMQGSSMSGLMSGAGGGPQLGIDWICGFNIPLITICAFFVLNIFLSLLNIVFFWLPIIKICIPLPTVSSGSPDEGTP